MDRRSFIIGSGSLMLYPLSVKGDLLRPPDFCHLRVRSGKVRVFQGHRRFEPKTTKKDQELVVMEDLPSVVYIDMASLQN